MKNTAYVLKKTVERWKKKISVQKKNCEISEGVTNARRSGPTNFDWNLRVSAVKVVENSWLSKLPPKKEKRRWNRRQKQVQRQVFTQASSSQTHQQCWAGGLKPPAPSLVGKSIQDQLHIDKEAHLKKTWLTTVNPSLFKFTEQDLLKPPRAEILGLNSRRSILESSDTSCFQLVEVWQDQSVSSVEKEAGVTARV